MEETLKAARFTERVLIPVCLALLGAAAQFYWRVQPDHSLPLANSAWFDDPVSLLVFTAPMVVVHYGGVLALIILALMMAGHLRHASYLGSKARLDSHERHLPEHVESARILLMFPWSPTYPSWWNRLVTRALFIALPVATALILSGLAWLNQAPPYRYIAMVPLVGFLAAERWLQVRLGEINHLASELRWGSEKAPDRYDDG